MPEQKKVVENGITTYYDYTLHGKLITHLTKRVVDLDGVETSEELHFFYDAQSRPAMVEYNSAMYSYLHNLQGDIIGIVDAEGTLVVEYKYDAWGKPVSITGSMASTLGAANPFLYRGYVYDTETGFYYLRSRYYSPGFARFINTDSICISGLLCNTFLYCLNQPTNMADSTGNESYSVVLNIYDKYEWNGLNGHYDIMIILFIIHL